MSTLDVQTVSLPRREMHRRPELWTGPPPLRSGDRLSRAEFERRYKAHPEIKKAELVEGIVHMPTPTRFELHSEPHAWIMGLLSVYVAATPGVRIGDNATVRLDLENEVQPDALLRLDPALGGRSHIGEDGYVEGPPELIVEVAASSAAYDLHDKKRVYARSGVQEYVAVQMYEGRIDWFALEESVYQALQPDEEGRLRSRIFAGLWLDPDAFWTGVRSAGSGQALAAILAVLQEGLASQEHADLVQELQLLLDKES